MKKRTLNLVVNLAGNGPEPWLGEEEGDVGTEFDPLPEGRVHVEGGIDETGDGLEEDWVRVVGFVLDNVSVELDASLGFQGLVDVGQVDGLSVIGAEDIELLELIGQLAPSVELVGEELTVLVVSENGNRDGPEIEGGGSVPHGDVGHLGIITRERN